MSPQELNEHFLSQIGGVAGLDDSHRRAFAEQVALDGHWNSEVGDAIPQLAVVHWPVQLQYLNVVLPATGTPQQTPPVTIGQSGPVVHMVRQLYVDEQGHAFNEHWSPAWPHEDTHTARNQEETGPAAVNRLLLAQGQAPLTFEEGELLPVLTGMSPSQQAEMITLSRHSQTGTQTGPATAGGRDDTQHPEHAMDWQPDQYPAGPEQAGTWEQPAPWNDLVADAYGLVWDTLPPGSARPDSAAFAALAATLLTDAPFPAPHNPPGLAQLLTGIDWSTTPAPPAGSALSSDTARLVMRVRLSLPEQTHSTDTDITATIAAMEEMGFGHPET
ncbi:hypothetical protein, partial [Streptomyces violaceorubidus]